MEPEELGQRFPEQAPGHDCVYKAMDAKLAVTPPVVGFVRTES